MKRTKKKPNPDGKLIRYSDAANDNDQVECDCGRNKQIGAESCSRCEFLDGRRSNEAAIIALLRTTSTWLSAQDIGSMLGRDPHALWRLLDEMVKSGRLCQEKREGDAIPTTGRCRYGGRQRRMIAGTAPAWVYSLATKRRAA